MSFNNLSFRNFLEDVEKKLSYFGGLEDEMGVNPEDAVKGGQVGSFFQMGDLYNLSPYKVVGFIYDDQGSPTHARCKIMNHPSLTTRKRWKKQHGRNVRIDDAEPDERTFTIPIENLEDLLTKGMSAGAAGAAGGMGAPGGGMGMGM